ncbi:MAG TPA: hypothetical protein VGP19_04555 [Candidatus Acidoferrales bacterium]|nr:hypothetical protein [Candidatus Acidoferrales bacterium]
MPEELYSNPLALNRPMAHLPPKLAPGLLCDSMVKIGLLKDHGVAGVRSIQNPTE